MSGVRQIGNNRRLQVVRGQVKYIGARHPIPPEPMSIVIVRKSQDVAFNIEGVLSKEPLYIVAVNRLASVPTPVAADRRYPAKGIEVTHMPQRARLLSKPLPCFA